MKHAIIVDSGCDLIIDPTQNTEDLYMSRVPLRLRIGEKEYVDDFSLDIPSFMKEMSEYPGSTGSAAPSPQEWYDAFMQADEVFAVTITGGLSGSYSSAMAGRDMILEDYPDKKICIVDSKSAGGGLTILVRKLQEYIAGNLPFEEIVEKITDYKQNTRTYFILESMDNLVKNGRVSPLIGKLAGILGIKILGQASTEGTIELLHKCRGKATIYKKAVQEMIESGYNGGKVSISHCFSDEKVNLLLDLIKEHFPTFSVEVIPTSGLCSYYAEENGIILAFEK